MKPLLMEISNMRCKNLTALLCSFITVIMLSGVGQAAEYQLNWKNELSEGSTGICKIRLRGEPRIGPSNIINTWEWISLPFNSSTPVSLFAGFEYYPASNCSKLIVEATCLIRPAGTEWIHRLDISPCQNRTIGFFDRGMRLH